MKRFLHKLPGFLLLLCLMAVLFTMTSYADPIPASGTWGDCNWRITEDGELTVDSGTGENTGGTSPWAAYADQITIVYVNNNINLPQDSSHLFDGFTSMTTLYGSGLKASNETNMSSMFNGCSALTSIYFGPGWGENMSKVENMSSMFNGCSSLTSLKLIDWDTDKVTNTESMFNGCSALTSVTFGAGWNTSNVTDMSNMFNGCSSLTSLTFGLDWDTDNVTDMSSMFNGCSSLSSVTFVSGWDTDNVTDLSSMFSGCSSLTSLTFGLSWARKVTDMSSMFNGCSSLTSLTFGDDWYTSNVTDLSSMFNGCSALTSLNLSSWYTGNVTNMSNMFSGCSSLTSLTFGSSWYTDHVKDMSDMFNGCSSLTSLDLSGWQTGQVTKMTDFLIGCSNLTELTVPAGYKVKVEASPAEGGKVTITEYQKDGIVTVEAFPNTADGYVFTGWKAGETAVSSEASYSFTPGADTTLTAVFVKLIASGSWGTCPWEIDTDGMLTVHPGEGATNTNVSPWTNYADKITSIAFVKENNKSVVAPTYCYGLFSGLSEVISMDLTGLDTGNMTSLYHMFYGCSSLKTITFGSVWDTSTVDSMDGMFQGCSSLTTLNLPRWNTGNVMKMGHMFQECSSLTTLNLPRWNTGNLKYMDSMFQGCTSLTTLNLSDWNTDKVVDMKSMFSGCSKLTSLNLKGWIIQRSTNMEDFLSGCDKLTELTIPKGKVTVAASPTEGGTATITDMNKAQQITVTATPNTGDGYSFSGWKAGETTASSSASYTFTPTANITLTAVFTKTETLSIEITGNTDTKTYNAAEQSVGGFSVKYKVGSSDWTETAPAGVSVSLKTGQTAEAKGTNAGGYSMGLTADSFNITTGTSYTLGTVTVNDGRLTIGKAALTITANDQSYVWNGNPQGEGDTVYEDAAQIAEKVSVTGLQGTDYIHNVTLDGTETDVNVYPDRIEPSQAAVWRGSDTVTDSYKITYVKGKLTISKAKYSVSVTAGTGMTKTTASGALSQEVTAGSAMTPVVFDADGDHYFPADYADNIAAVNGIDVTRNSYTQITVSGTPTAAAQLTLPAATAKTTPSAPEGVGKTDCTTEADNDGTITGVDSTMEYRKDGTSGWTVVTGTTVTGLADGTYHVRIKATDTAKASPEVDLVIAPFTETYTVSFAPGGGTGSMTPVTGKAYGDPYELPACTFNAPEEKTFDCWSVGGEDHQEGDTITVTGNTTVTAKWKDIPPTPHEHELVLRDKVPASCTEDGHTAYYECVTCGRWFGDALALAEITDRSSVVLKRTGHRWDGGVITREPTATETGVRTYTCLNDASHTKTEAIPATGGSGDTDSYAGNGSSSGGSGRHRGSVSSAGSGSTNSGTWSRDASGWHYLENGVPITDAWREITYNGERYWYYFDTSGNMMTGWLDQGGRRYYLDTESNGWQGHMRTGWVFIDGKWYYFEPDPANGQGHLYMDAVTPDGYRVGRDGAWDGSSPVR